MLLRMTGIWFLYVEVLGWVGVSGGSSEDLVLCRVGGSVGELVVLRFLRLRWTSVNSPSWLSDDMSEKITQNKICVMNSDK